jgi:hypothetical protein
MNLFDEKTRKALRELAKKKLSLMTEVIFREAKRKSEEKRYGKKRKKRKDK